MSDCVSLVREYFNQYIKTKAFVPSKVQDLSKHRSYYYMGECTYRWGGVAIHTKDVPRWFKDDFEPYTRVMVTNDEKLVYDSHPEKARLSF